jgi:hypothetical protein
MHQCITHHCMNDSSIQPKLHSPPTIGQHYAMLPRCSCLVWPLWCVGLPRLLGTSQVYRSYPELDPPGRCPAPQYFTIIRKFLFGRYANISLSLHRILPSFVMTTHSHHDTFIVKLNWHLLFLLTCNLTFTVISYYSARSLFIGNYRSSHAIQISRTSDIIL